MTTCFQASIDLLQMSVSFGTPKLLLLKSSTLFVQGVYDSRRGHQDGTTSYSKHQGQMIMINHDDKVHILGKNLLDSREFWLRSSSIDSSVLFNDDVNVDVFSDIVGGGS